jgi:hypothetical protein
MSGYPTHGEEILALKREVEKLKAADADKARRIALLEYFCDSEARGRAGITVDQIRESWGRAKPPVPESGAV